MRDFRRLQQDPPQGVNGSPSADNIMRWKAVIFGPEDTPWDGGERRERRERDTNLGGGEVGEEMRGGGGETVSASTSTSRLVSLSTLSRPRRHLAFRLARERNRERGEDEECPSSPLLRSLIGVADDKKERGFHPSSF